MVWMRRLNMARRCLASGGKLSLPLSSQSPCNVFSDWEALTRRYIAFIRPIITLDEFGNVQSSSPSRPGTGRPTPGETPRKVSKPLPGLPAGPSRTASPDLFDISIPKTEPLRRTVRAIGSNGSLAVDGTDSIPCLGETAEDYEASLDASLTATPTKVKEREELKKEKKKKRSSVPPSLPSFSDFRLVAELNWSEGGAGLETIGSRSSLMTATLDVR